MKQETPILVILGNPPYNGFAGMAVDEERDLSDAYRTTRRVRRPEGQGLNDLYVRFFRMAERRIAEKTGRGVVCFISKGGGRVDDYRGNRKLSPVPTNTSLVGPHNPRPTETST